MRHQEGSFAGVRNAGLYYQGWLPEGEPKAVLLVVHGLAEHSGRYMNLVNRFVPRGYALYGIDHLGHGRSEGQRLVLERFSDYTEPLRTYAAMVRCWQPGRPVFLVAHSMGGLIARSALIEPDQHNRAVKLFVSLSTPWGGEQRAKTGVAHSPAVIPSWKDMEPDSDFIRSVFARKLPAKMRYYLFFGHKGGGDLFRQNNDNTVTLESMLDPRAQADALKVIGFNEDHLSILTSAEVVSQYRAVVAATEGNLKKSMAATHGYVDLRRSFLPADVKIPLHMAFVLVPTAGEEAETQLKVDPSLTRQETGAVAPGDYAVSLCALTTSHL